MMASSVNFCLALQTFWTWRYSEPSKQRNILHQAKHLGLGDIRSHPSRGTFCIKMEALKKRQLKQDTALFAQSEDDDDVAKEVTGSMESINNGLESINNGVEEQLKSVEEQLEQLMKSMMDEREDFVLLGGLLREVAIDIENELKLDYLNQCPPELQARKKMPLTILMMEVCEARKLLEESVGAAAAADVDRQWYIASAGFGGFDIGIVNGAFFDAMYAMYAMEGAFFNAMYVMKHPYSIAAHPTQLGKRYTSLKEQGTIAKDLIDMAEVGYDGWIDVIDVAIVKDLIDRAEAGYDEWKDVAKAYVDKLYERKVNNSLNMNKLL